MLRWRFVLGTVIVAALVGLCWLDWQASRPGIVLLPLAILLAVLAAGELLAMFRKRGHQPLAWVVYTGTLLAVIAASLPGLGDQITLGSDRLLLIALATSLLLAILGELQRYDGSGRATVNLSLAVFAIMYAGGLIGFLVQLRLMGGNDRLGMLALVSLIAIVKMSDIGQYTAGRLFGRHKLAPQVSPGKTWEGVIGGVVFACFAAWALMTWAAPSMVGVEKSVAGVPLVRTMVYAITLAAAGMVGDLAESLLKRDAGVKDSSTWFPGYGGVLDLVDSLLGAAPVAYLFWAMGWVGP